MNILLVIFIIILWYIKSYFEEYDIDKVICFFLTQIIVGVIFLLWMRILKLI